MGLLDWIHIDLDIDVFMTIWKSMYVVRQNEAFVVEWTEASFLDLEWKHSKGYDGEVNI